MSAEKVEKVEKKETKELTVKILRKKGVKPRDEVIERSKEQRKIMKQIAEILKSNPKTIPEVADEIKMPSGIVTWYIMTMHKYGKVKAVEEVNGYFEYKSKEEEGK